MYSKNLTRSVKTQRSTLISCFTALINSLDSFRLLVSSFVKQQPYCRPHRMSQKPRQYLQNAWLFNCLRRQDRMDEVSAQWLTARIVLAKDQSTVPSTHIKKFSQLLQLHLQGTLKASAFTYIPTHTYNLKLNLKESKIENCTGIDDIYLFSLSISQICLLL